MNRITRFNPHLMPDDLILALNTGREKEQRFVQEIIDRNVEGGRPPQHILLYGPRGIGKSFFLRLLQIHLAKQQQLCFVLLPEEQRNVYQPADLIREIKNHLAEERLDAGIGAWGSSDVVAWRTQVAELEGVWETQGKPHLVVGWENVDLLFSKGGAFEKREDQFLLREFLTETPWLTLIATTLYPDLDTRYEDALFHFFAKHELRSWREPQHVAYLRKRNEQAGKKTTRLSLAQLKSLTRFTGGSPRITVIMVDVVADANVNSAAEALEMTIDELTPYYQDLLSRIPPKSRMLFDALIRGGEPCSQSELAARVGVTQNVISQSFAWLKNHSYLHVERPEGEKQKLYSVRDRLFAHYYRMRHILHGSGKSILSVMGEFLTHFFSRVQLKEQAAELYERGAESMSRELMHIALEDTGINPEALAWKDDVNALMEALDLSGAEEIPKPTSLEEARALVNRLRDLLAACTHCPAEIDPEEFAYQVFGSLSLTLEEKAKVFKSCLGGTLSPEQWLEYKKIFEGLLEIVQSYLGKTFQLLRDRLANGDIILEFIDDHISEQLKEKDIHVYHTLVAFHELEHLSLSPQPAAQIEAYQYLLQLVRTEGNLTAQAWNLGRIGWNLQKLGRHEESLAAHREALELCIEEGNREWQAWNLGRTGWNLRELGRHEEALASHREALELRIEEGNRDEQAWNLGQIGWNLQELGRHEESLALHREALKLRIEEGNRSEQAWNLGRIGWNLQKLGRHEESLAAHQESLELCIEEGREGQAWNAGRIAVNRLLLNQQAEAWQGVDKHRDLLGDLRYEMIMQLGDAVTFYQRQNETAKAYATGRNILENLLERRDTFEAVLSVGAFFIDLFGEGADVTLIEDLLEAATDIFGEDVDLALEGIRGVVAYLKSGKAQNVLVKMAPETRKVVETLVEELKL